MYDAEAYNILKIKMETEIQTLEQQVANTIPDPDPNPNPIPDPDPNPNPTPNPIPNPSTMAMSLSQSMGAKKACSLTW